MDNRAKTIRITLQDGEIVGSENVAKTETRPSGGPGPKQYQCPHCGVVFETDEPIEGMRVDCPECGGEFVAKSCVARAKSRPARPSIPSKPPKKVGKAVGLGIVLLAMLGAAAGAGWWFWWGKKGADVQPEMSDENVDVPQMPLEPVPKRPIATQAKPVESVKATLDLRPVDAHCLQFGGRVPPDSYAYSSVADGIPHCLEGNPLYFMSSSQMLWNYYEACPGGGYVFIRKPFENFDKGQLASFHENAKLPLQMAVLNSYLFDRYNFSQLDDVIISLWTNAWTSTIQYPAPVVFSYAPNAEHFIYLNDSGNPSAMRWGVATNYSVYCFEGASALAKYAKSLRELRKILVDYTQIAKDEQLTQYKKKIELDAKPEIYIADLLRGTRKKAAVQYEFLVETGNNNTSYSIKQETYCPSGGQWFRMELETLDKELEFFSRFETSESTEKAFAPLYCFLTQKKILCEESARESNRLARRFEGRENTADVKKEQILTFKPIGEQSKDASVELEAAAESGGKVVFAVESGPGKISDKMLTFTATGKVVVCARQWGNEQWYSAAATQTVTVVNAHRYKTDNSSAETTGSNRDRASSALSSGLAAMIVVLEAAQNEQTPENFSKMERAWKALSGSRKLKLQKNVLWASCAMYLAKGHPERLAQRKAYLDTRALMEAVSEECRSCHGRGHGEESCRKCGGSGYCNFPGCNGGRIERMLGKSSPCPNCHGNGRCPVCSGSGSKQVKCTSCNGSGRILSRQKCMEVVDENIEEALFICMEEE